ncbi:hypothetical protein U14_04130 [Candidatus Moduliflexus flocculans]|uniref:Uncharacterized protein n=1 Tax=Candidatus Moduliflexus flocculans TaxID=1499966 RepID=A0A0S6W3J1_9BACT|nr:hypothetical protein U14_04130 [Candidatus Moduliflexus flocculans]
MREIKKVRWQDCSSDRQASFFPIGHSDLLSYPIQLHNLNFFKQIEFMVICRDKPGIPDIRLSGGNRICQRYFVFGF